LFGGADTAKASEDTIKVGVLHSLSGTMAISETTLKDTVLFMIDQQNKKGGVLGRKLEAVVVDPASNWPMFAEKARELITKDKVSVVFGCWTSVSRKSVLPVFKELNSILFYPVQYEGEESERNVFYTGAVPNQQAIPAVDYLMKEANVKRWVLAGTDYVYPRTTNKILEAYLRSKGVKEEDIMISYTPFGHSDWQTIVADIKKFGSAGKKTAVVSTINGDANIPFYRELGNQGIKATDIPVVTLSIGEEELAGIDTKPLVGHLAAWNYFQSIKTPANEKFIKDWQAYTKNPKRTTNDPMEATYIGFKMWVKAVEKTKSVDADEVIDALPGIEVANLTGGVAKMLPNHHVTKPVFIGEIKADGQFEVVSKTPENIAGSLFSDQLPDHDLVGDWVNAKCKNFDQRTKNCTRDPQVIELLYATTRGVSGGDHSLMFDDVPSKLSFGALQVRVPEGHEFGKVDRPGLFASFTQWIFAKNAEGKFELKDSKRLDKPAFVRSVQDFAADEALVFVHGFKHTFEESAFRLAQIVWDIQYKGVPVLFAWPSGGELAQYLDDYDNAEFSRAAFLELLRTLKLDAKVKRVSVIAHSMGNRVVEGALARSERMFQKPPIFQLVLAAPDVKRSNFMQELPASISQASGVTLYASENDYALKASKALRSFSRGGDTSPPDGPVIMTGLDTIDVSTLGDEIFGMHHDTFAAKLPLVDEIGRLIKTGIRPPDERTPVLRLVRDKHGQYWRYP